MSNFDINILVNGNRCKQYTHNGRIFIEAKQGSEYEIEFKNNSYSRVLLVGSVDGLSVMNGETAKPDSKDGYVIDGYSSFKIKGFRYSNDEVGAFRFTTKNNSYAAVEKGSDAAQHVGVIGIKVYQEKIEFPTFISANTITTDDNFRFDRYTWRNDTGTPHNPTWYGTTSNLMTGGLSGNYSAQNASNNLLRSINNRSLEIENDVLYGCSLNDSSADYKSSPFDMGTDWGSKKESKVKEVEFKVGNEVFSLDIYYASRQSLIEMGVPIYNEAKVTFPQSFPGKYSTPPKNWRG
jgi:hypothetical protein